MSLTSFVVSRSLASDPLRTALSLLGVALGVAIVVAIYVMDHNTIQSHFRKQDLLRGPVDLEVTPRRPETLEQTVSDLRRRNGIADVGVWREARGLLQAGERTLEVAVYGLAPLPGGPFAHYAVLEGRDLEAADGDGAVLLGAEAARLLQVGPGARLRLQQPLQGTRYECRDGELVALPADGTEPFAREVEVVGTLLPQRLGRREFGQVMVSSRDLASRLRPGGADLLQLQRRYGADLDRLRRELEADYVVADLRSAMIGEGADERAFRNGIKVLGGLALLLGMFVVFQTLSQGLLARLRLLGLLRCLGMSRNAAARIFLGEALLLGCSGAALGLLLGVGLARLLQAHEISSLGAGKQWLSFELPLLPMLWTAGLGVLFTLAGALFPLWRARQLPALWILRQRNLDTEEGGPGELMRGVNLWLFLLLVFALPLAYLAMTPLVAEEGRETLIVLLQMVLLLAVLGGLLLLAPVALAVAGRTSLWLLRPFCPLAAFLCRKTLHRQAGRIAAGVVGLGAVLLAFLGLETITASLRGDVRAFAAVALQDRAFVEVPPRTAESLGAWTGLPGVAAVEPVLGEVQAGFVLRGAALEVVGGADGALAGAPDLVRRFADTRVRTMVVSRRLANKKGWQPGSLVALLDHNRTPVSYQVLAVSDATGYVPSEQAWAVIAPHWMQRDFCVGGDCVRWVVLRLDPAADAGFVAGHLRALEPGYTRFRSGAEIRDYHLRDVDRDFYLFDLLLLLILGLAGTGLLNGMTIAALGRTRELGVLRALGVGRASLRGALLLEGLVTGGLAAGLALLLAVPMAHVLIGGLNRVAGLEAPVVLPVAWLLLVPLMALGTAVLAAWLPARRAARQDPAVAVRFE